jgi:hypothetical protein
VANASETTSDRDSDGIPDWWEAKTGSWSYDSGTKRDLFVRLLDWENAVDSSEDYDSDGLSNLEEIQNGTDPKNWDSDGDLLPDGWEVQMTLDPLDNGTDNLRTTIPSDGNLLMGSTGDPDGDGLSNLQELIHGTNPKNMHSDGDGVDDGIEVAQGSDPNDPSDGGQPPPADQLVEVPFTVGDPSGSHSERWKMNIKGDGPDDHRQFGLVSPNFGQMSPPTIFKLRRGNSYTITLTHVATNRQDGKPDYDWEAQVDSLPAKTVLKSSGNTHPAEDRYEIIKEAWLLDNKDGLLGWNTDSLGETNFTTGKKATLTPVEVESMDRYLSGSIPESVIDSFGGASKFGLVFRNQSSGETYSFNKLSEAHVYDDPFGATDEDEDKFLSNSEIAAWANGPNSASKELNQDVVFYRKDGKLHFRTLFDQAGPIEIGLIKDGQEIGKIDWTLTPDALIADLLETVDSTLSGNHDDDGGVILAAINAGVSGEDLEDMRAIAASPQFSGGGFSGFIRRNLTIKVNIPTWEAMKENFEQGVRKAGAAVDRAITVATFAGKGFCEGAWYGVKDDATSLVELGKMILNPAETAKTFYEGFKVLIDLDMQGWKNVGKTLVESFLKTGNEGVGEWSEPNALDVASYLVGFTAGYITEQIVVTYVTAGILKAGNVGAKIGKFIRDAAKGLKTALAPVAEAAKILYQNALKAKNSIFRRFSQDVAGIDDVKALKRMVHEMTLSCPVP